LPSGPAVSAPPFVHGPRLERPQSSCRP
jgi:hypothetical protein